MAYKKRKKLFKNDLIRNASMLSSATVLCQVSNIIASPLLTRLFTIEDFAVWTIFLAISGQISVITCLRYDAAVVVCKNNDSASAVLKGAIIINFLISMLFLLFIFSFESLFKPILVKNNLIDLLHLIYWIPLMTFLLGLSQLIQNWFIKQEKLEYNAYFRIIKTFSQILIIISLGYYGYGAKGMIYSSILSSFTVVIFFLFFLKREWAKALKNTKIKNVIIALKKEKEFVFVNAPHVFIDNIQNHGFTILIGSFFDSAVSGAYGFILRTIRGPMTIVSGALNQVVFSKTSNEQDEFKRERLVLSIIKIGFILSLFLIPVMFSLPEIFEFIFGKGWGEAARYGQVLIPYFYISAIANILSSIPIVVKEQKKSFGFSVAGSVIRFLGLGIAIYLVNFYLGLLFISIFHSLLLLFALFWIIKISKKVR